eukprot:11950222-Karenia_brevis.AAC.1
MSLMSLKSSKGKKRAAKKTTSNRASSGQRRWSTYAEADLDGVLESLSPEKCSKVVLRNVERT